MSTTQVLRENVKVGDLIEVKHGMVFEVKRTTPLGAEGLLYDSPTTNPKPTTFSWGRLANDLRFVEYEHLRRYAVDQVEAIQQRILSSREVK